MKSHFNKGLVGSLLVGILTVSALVTSLVALKQNADLKSQVSSATQNQQLGAFQPSGGVIYKLQNSITASQTTLNLTSFKEPVSNIKYTMTILGSSYGFGTIEPKNSTRSEFIKFTGITQNSDGTATLTGVTRGLPRSNPVAGGCTASTTLALSHGGQSEFILSNSPCEQTEYALKNYDDTITGMWTIPTPLSNLNPATKAYVDSHVNGGTVSNAQVVIAGTAGETISAGQILYLKQTDGRWYKASVATAEASSSPLSIAQGAGTSGNPVTGGVLLDGLDSNQSGLSTGSNYFVGPTAGTISLATSTRILGRAKDNTNIYFHPDYFMPNLAYTVFTMNASTTFQSFVNFFGSITRFGNTNSATSSVDVVATSSMKIGAFPAYDIGKHTFASTTSGTFQVPWGISRVKVWMCGGGGSGAGSSGATIVGASGGGGACGMKDYDVTGVSTVSYTIGAGGAGVASGSGGGNDGGTTSFGTFSCLGGGHPSNSGAGIAGASGGATCTGEDAEYPGGNGFASFGGSTSFAIGGSSMGGPSTMGYYGSGGGGTANTSGGNGVSGYIVVTW